MEFYETYESESLGETRVREKLSVLPVINIGNELVWTGKWFKTVRFTEEKIKERFAYFDPGWDYNWHWGPWVEKWKFFMIID